MRIAGTSIKTSVKGLSRWLTTYRQPPSIHTRRLHTYDPKDWHQLTVLQWAARHGHTSLAEWAISKGADLNNSDLQCEKGGTPLHAAVRYNHPAIIRLLMKHGAGGSAEDNKENTPLHLAATSGDVEATRLLLELGADMMCINGYGRMPAHSAAYSGNIGCMEAFIDAGFDLGTIDCNGATVLHCAAAGDLEMTEYLLGRKEAAIGINAQDFSGCTPLHEVTDSETVELLLRHGADIDARDNNGDTPIFSAAGRRSVKCFRALMDAGFDLNTKGHRGRTVLHTAVGSTSADKLVEYMLRERGASIIINAQDSEGLTPLALAPYRCVGMEEMYDLLVRYGADPEIEDHGGETPAYKMSRIRDALKRSKEGKLSGDWDMD